MVHYKLTYFNARGRAEIIRLIFAFAKQEYVDERIEFKDWPALKPRTPLGQLPYLEIKDGAKEIYLGQSMTIGIRNFSLISS